MVDKKTLFVVVSKDDNPGPMIAKLNELSKSNQNVLFDVVLNNRENITKVYNKFLNKSENYECVVFLHADVEFNLDSFYSHVCECYSKYDVMGLCGCEKFSISESPLNWYCGSRKYSKFRWGCVTHGELGNQTSFWSGDRRDTTDHSVACIDGLCIIMTDRAIKDGLRFDEELKFNCYDTQISLDTVMVHKMKLGCLVEESLVHYSVGKSILTDEFLNDELVLRNKFNLGIPPGSKIEKYLTNRN